MRCSHLFCLISFLFISGCEQHNPESEAQSNPAEQPSATAKRTVSLRPDSLPYIKVQEIQPEAFAGTISAPARVDFRAQAISTAGTVVAGRITKIHVQIGDRIKAGAPLATLASGEATQMRSDYARAVAELTRAEDHLRRQMEMQRTGVGLEIERVEADTQLKQAKTELERSRDFLKLLGDGSAAEVIVRAPMDSMILKAHVSTGAAVAPGAPLFDLGEPSAAWIIADVFEKDLLLVEKGAKAVIELASSPEPILGHVVAESAAIQTDLRRASVFIEPDDPKLSLRPGMYARVTIEASTPNRIILPTASILIKDGRETLVYVETAPNVFEARPVQVGQSREGITPVLKGLSGGERVVVSGALLLDGEASLLL
ncbi:efflux RND transporter periplasmic adaptor subunit [Methylomonas sp. BW4-1]|uniref:efflux RND transporter periplasmic adaptor subunit n=1 Tax=Methylomonas sp. BW4-1 TaxID=3376685 RepID=UPI0040414464